MVREEVVLVVQEEIVSALLLFRVLRDREDRSVSVSIKLYQQVSTATIKENVQYCLKQNTFESLLFLQATSRGQ